MADKSITIVISAKDMSAGEIDKARRALAGFGGDVKQHVPVNESWTDSVKKNAVAYLAGIATWETAKRAIGALKDFVLESVEAAAEAQRIQVSLNSALTNSRQPVASISAAFQEYAKHIQATTALEDDEVLSVMALATEMGVMAGDMGRVISVSANLAAAWGIPLRGAMELLVKGGEGMTKAFRAHSIELDVDRAKAEGLAYVLPEVAKHFNSNAQDQLNTYTGRVTSLSVAWGNLKEALGGMVTSGGGLTNMLGGVTLVIRGITDTIENKTLTAWQKMAMLVGVSTTEFAKMGAEATIAATHVKATGDRSLDAAPHIETLAEAAQKAKDALAKAEAAAKKTADALAALKAAEDAMSGKKLIDETNALIATYERLVAQGLKPTKEQQDKIAASIENATAAAKETGQVVPAEWNKVWIATKDFTQETSLAALSMEDIAKIGRQLSDETLPTTGIAIAGVGAMMDQAARRAAELAAANDAVRKKMGDLAIGLPAVVQGMAVVEESMEDAAEAAKEKLARGFVVAANAFDSLARTASLAGHDTIATVLSIGAQTLDNMRNAEGGVLKAAAAFDGLAQVAAATGHTTTAAILSIASNTAKAFAQGGPWAAAIAFGTSVITAFADKIFKLEGKKVNDLRDAFFAAAGGFEALHQKLIDANAEDVWQRLWNAGKVADWEAAVKDADAALEKLAGTQGEIAALQQLLADRQKLDWEKADELATKYGGTLSGLGGQFEAAKLHAGFAELWNDWETLEDMGGDVGGMLTMFKEEIGHLVAESKRIGTEIPEQFKPVIEDLIKTGQLFDDNGVAITDMSGMKFGAPLVSEVDKIVQAIKELVDALRGPLSGAIAGIPREINIDVGYTYDPYNPPSGDVGEEEIPAYAAGGLVTRPQRAWIAERGEAEIVGPISFMERALAGAMDRLSRRAGGGGSTSSGGRDLHVHLNVDGREMTSAVLQLMQGELAFMGVR